MGMGWGCEGDQCLHTNMAKESLWMGKKYQLIMVACTLGLGYLGG